MEPLCTCGHYLSQHRGAIFECRAHGCRCRKYENVALAEDWGFMPYNSRSNTVVCVLCGAHGWGIPTRDRDGNPRWSGDVVLSFAAWQRRCWGPHPYFCACGKAFPHLQALGAHVAANRRWRNPGHGSMERVGFPA